MTKQEIKSEDFQKLFSAILGQTDIKEYHKNLLTSHINILESLFESYFRKFESFSSSHDKSVYSSKKYNEKSNYWWSVFLVRDI